MTKTQIKFYNMLKTQMVDFEDIFHKDFMIEKISQIPDEKLKYLLEDINLDKDKIGRKGYITYAKFAHYATKMIDTIALKLTAPKLSQIDKLLKKRELMLRSIEQNAPTIAQKNQLISDIASKRVMFKGEDGKNLLTKLDYILIGQYGFYNFLDENNNYNLKERLETYLKEYNKQFLKNNNQLLLK